MDPLLSKVQKLALRSMQRGSPLLKEFRSYGVHVELVQLVVDGVVGGDHEGV